MFNLGTFAMLIFAHVSLDYVKYREYHGYSLFGTIEGIIRESILDFTLLLMGMVFSVYLHHSVAFPGISGLLRTEITILRLFGTLIPKYKILHNFLKIIAHIRHYLDHAHPHIRKHWSSFDKVCFWSIGLCSVLLLLSAKILSVDNSVIVGILKSELIPNLFLSF